MPDNNNSQTLLTNIYREVGETKVTVEGLSKRIELHIDESTTEFKAINELDHEQNRILDKHIEGVTTLKDLYIAHRLETSEQVRLLQELLDVSKKDFSARVESLEKPYDLVKFAGKIVVWVATVAGAIAGLLKLFGGL